MAKLSTAEVLRLRATSAVARDRSVKRFAQDDGFAGVLMKNIPIRLTLMGLASWAKFSRPFGLILQSVGSHADSLARRILNQCTARLSAQIVLSTTRTGS